MSSLKSKKKRNRQKAITAMLVLLCAVAVVLIVILLPKNNRPSKGNTSAQEISMNSEEKDQSTGTDSQAESGQTESGREESARETESTGEETSGEIEDSKEESKSAEDSEDSGEESHYSHEDSPASDIEPMSKTGKSYWLTHIRELFKEASTPISGNKSTNELYDLTKLLFTCKRAQIETGVTDFDWGIFAKDGMSTSGMKDFEEYVLRTVKNMKETTKIEWANVDLDFDKVSLSGSTCTVTVYENFKIVYLNEGFGEGHSFVGTRYKITYTFNGKQWFITKMERNV